VAAVATNSFKERQSVQPVSHLQLNSQIQQQQQQVLNQSLAASQLAKSNKKKKQSERDPQPD